jgi:NAD(P)H-nitrite reductase large subunit
VLTFRDLSRAVLGVEAACGLAKRGLAVTLIHVMSRIMERQLETGPGASKAMPGPSAWC